jgi:hypothetical protein
MRQRYKREINIPSQVTQIQTCKFFLLFVVLISDSYVADEIITSRAEVRIRVGNTDAEGRMVMADVLYKMKEDVG